MPEAIVTCDNLVKIYKVADWKWWLCRDWIWKLCRVK